MSSVSSCSSSQVAPGPRNEEFQCWLKENEEVIRSISASYEEAAKMIYLTNYRMTYAKDPGTEGEKLLKQTKYALQSSSTKICTSLKFLLGGGFDLKGVPDFVDTANHVTISTHIGSGKVNEDFCSSHTIQMSPSEKANFYGMYDGHSDLGKCARFVAHELPKRIQESLWDSPLLDHQAITDAIIKAVHDIEEQWQKDGGSGGTTATCALQFDGKIYIPNIGDSRALLFKKEKDKLYQLSEDAKPDDPRFASRIMKMGGYVSPETEKDVARANGRWAVARDIGVADLSPRPKITFISAADSPVDDDPEKGFMTYQKGDILFLLTDGLLDNVSNKELEEALKTMHNQSKDLECMIKTLMRDNCWMNSIGGTGDNITVMGIRL